jgi:hypothetical protein
MQIQVHPLPAGSAGNGRQLQSLHFGKAATGHKTYIQAALHADEIPGMLAAQHLREQLTALELADNIPGEIVLVPVANPIGLAQAIQGQPFGRFDLATGVNFNRAYRNLTPQLKQRLTGKLGRDAAENVLLVRRAARLLMDEWQPLNETDTLKKMLQTLAIDADIVLDLHCDNEAVMHLYTGSPLSEMVQPLGRLLGAEAMLLSRDSGGDPFDETCGRIWWELAEHFGPDYPLPLACLSVTVELRGQTEVRHALARQDASALIAFLVQQGHILTNAGDAGLPLPPARCQPTPLEGMEPLRAPHAGIIVFHKAVGDMVLAGDAVAELIDPASGQSTLVCATVSGKLFARTALRHAQRGTDLARIAGAVAYRSGNLLTL